MSNVDDDIDRILATLNIKKGGLDLDKNAPAQKHYYLSYDFTDWDTEKTTECKVNYNKEVKQLKQAITTLLEQSERKARIKTVEVLKKDVNTILNKWYRNRPLETVGSSFGGWEIKLRKELQDRISALKGEQ